LPTQVFQGGGVRTTVDRNESCPCGSGKKFKKCCLQRLQDYKASLVADGRLRKKLVGFMESELARADLERAFNAFFGANTQVSEADMMRFNAWLIHDFRVAEDETLIERFLARRGQDIPPEELALLQDRLVSRPGAYEVARIRRDIGVDLVDILTDERFDVMDVSASKSLVEWDVVWARLFRLRNQWAMDGSALAFPHTDKDDIVSVVRRNLDSFMADNPRGKQDEAMRRRFADIDRELRGLWEGMRWEAVTREGDEVAFSKAVYAVTDFPGAKKQLMSLRNLEREPPVRKDASRISFSWIEKKGDAQEPPHEGSDPGVRRVMFETTLMHESKPDRIVMGSVNLSRDQVLLECMSKQRLARLREMIECALGSSVALKDVSIVAADEALDDFDWVEEPQERIRPPREFVQRHIDEWLREPVPFLDGLSPLEAVKSAKGRVQVRELLKDMLNSLARSEEPLLERRDIESIAKTLGVPMPS
jgi:hypothetical protein